MPNPPPQLRAVIVDAIANVANRSPDELHDDVDLLDLGLDSLDFARILIDIEDALDAEVPPYILDRIIEETPDIVTMRSILNLLSTWDTTQTHPGFGPPSPTIVVTADDLSLPR